MLRLPVTIFALLAALVPADIPQSKPIGEAPAPGLFTFVRVEYDSEGGYGEAYYDYDGRFWLRWQTDYPEAEQNFLYRIGQLTTIKVNPEPISLRLTDSRIYDFPFLYMCDVGWQRLTRAEARALRRYLLRGGFLWVDDFWGNAEWRNFERNMRDVFPEYDWRPIPNTHPILNIVFPLDQCPQVPAKIFWDSWRETFDHPDVHRQPAGGTRGVRTVNFRGLFDKSGRLMAVATHNTDIGDGWERETEHEEFFAEFSVKSFAMGINILTYALTH